MASPIVFVLAAAGGYLMSRRALGPVERITRTAQSTATITRAQPRTAVEYAVALDRILSETERTSRLIFERFHRVAADRSRTTGGVGLGLSIAQWIATSHDARILVGSDPA